MNNYVDGATIKTLREKKNYTQKELADVLMISDKTVSKWETGRGLPDITLLQPLANALDVSISELISGQCKINNNKSSNMLKLKFYVCPVCSNVIISCGEGDFSCCGVSLPPLEIEDEDKNHTFNIEIIENEHYVSSNHPMDKEHYISFIAHITTDNIEIKKLYPQQSIEARFKMNGRGKFFAYCNKHGLFEIMN